MKKSRFREDEIVKILETGEAGTPLSTLCLENHISSSTYYQWRSKYKNSTLLNIKRIKELEFRNKELRKLYLQAIEQKKILQNVIEGKL